MGSGANTFVAEPLSAAAGALGEEDRELPGVHSPGLRPAHLLQDTGFRIRTNPQRWNAPIQGLTADALKAIAVEAHERQEEIAGLRMAALIHDEVIWVVPEERAEKAARWLTAIMEATADAMVNGDAPPEECVSIKADTSVCGSWADK